MAVAQRWLFMPSVDTLLTVTDNGRFDGRGEKEADVIVEVTPALAFRRAGGRFRFDGTVSGRALTYVEGTQSSRIDPALNVTAGVEAIDDFFFIDGAVQLQRTIENPFGPQGAPIGVNSVREFRARISPYVTGNLGSRVTYLLRNDSSWIRSRNEAVTRSDEYATRQSAEVSLLPRPFGLSLTYGRDDTNIETGVAGRRTTEIARAIALFSPGPSLTMGLRAGHEKNNYPGFRSDRDLFGANLLWRPTERTNFSVVGEKRFFGNGWQFSFDHRMPRFAWVIRSARDVSTRAQRFLSLPATNNVAALIEASLVTRFPDPIERARQVEDLIFNRGLPRTLLAPVDIYTDRVELRTDHSVSASLLGVHNSLALTAFSAKTKSLADQSGLPSVVPSSLLDNDQRGVALSLAHQAGPTATFSAEAGWRETRGLGAFADEKTRQQTYQLRLTRRLTPFTTFTAGTRYQIFDSALEGDTTEAAVFVGLGHRF